MIGLLQSMTRMGDDVRKYVDCMVSVITPVYNTEKNLKKMIDSALNQTYSDIELILVDDCSSDSSQEIIKEYIKKYDNIIYFRQEKNLGAGAARNKALELASGQYVAFLDSDDVWYKDKIEKQILLMKEMKTPFCYTAIEMIDENDNVIKAKRKIKSTCNYNYLLKNTIIATSSVVVDRCCLGDFRMPLRRGGQDYATWLMLLRNNVVAYGIDEALTQYRVSNNSLSSNKFKSLKQVWEIQTKDENINKIQALINLMFFCLNAFKKYFF